MNARKVGVGANKPGVLFCVTDKVLANGLKKKKAG